MSHSTRDVSPSSAAFASTIPADTADAPHLSVGVEDRLPPWRTLLHGIQHVLVSNCWLDPVFVAAMIGLPAAIASNMVNAIFIAAGIVTLTQATRLARLPIVQGPSAAFDALMIAAGKANNLAAAAGGILVSGAIIFLLAVAGVIHRLRRLFTPVVSGSVITVVGLALSGFTLSEFLGGSPGTPGFLSAQTLAMSVPTALVVLLLSLFGRGAWRSYAFLIALVAGDVIGALLGRTHFNAVAGKGWLGLPRVFPYGWPQWHWATFVTFFIAYIVAVIEALGVYQAAAEMTGVDLDARRIRNGFAGEAVGSLLSTAIGGFPTTAYAQNVGLLRITGVGSRHPVVVAGVLFLILGLVPKVGAVLAATPDPVVGGVFLPAAASLVYSGISILLRMERTEVNYTIAGLSILLAVALPQSVAGMSGAAAQLLSNSVLVGAVTAIGLQVLLVYVPRALGWRGGKGGASRVAARG
ncbi:uracil permease [Alicyclobacillus cellulosilyticus]|uniref:Uracil permease n=1 Tax=Alicyclobacillus cellulosilyticus TaxID=1003997 RepID=A0A917NJZ8_9BACL|nr:solute carrier family 23 protein [Alicyclobacillus cellulosilyticus]GGJ03455.1 uracil permease [Alicyclobacillus cellulosilyticus]